MHHSTPGTSARILDRSAVNGDTDTARLLPPSPESRRADAEAALRAIWDLRRSLMLLGHWYYGNRYDLHERIGALDGNGRRVLLHNLQSLRDDLIRLPISELIDDEGRPTSFTIGAAMRVLSDALDSGALRDEVGQSVSLIGGGGTLLRLTDQLIQFEQTLPTSP
jgi:hypothetical protein